MKTLRSRKSLYVIAGAAVLILIALSPFIALTIAQYGLDWTVLSNVGGSYGPVSTILSGAALVEVVITVALQRTQLNASSEQGARQMQLELMRSVWSDPSLLQALETVPPGHEERAKQAVFLNMYFMYLRMGLRSGQISQSEIADLAAGHFSTEAGAYYWERLRQHMTKHFEPAFVQALNTGFDRAQAQPTGFFLDWQPPRPASSGTPQAGQLP